MPIYSENIKLLESERMTDATDGGGRRTSRVVVDGVAGNVFPKVSRLDAVYGRVNLRKVYGHVDTANAETYAGAHFIITDAPDNERIHVTAFSTGSEFDQRTAARDRVESYVIAGPESRLQLYGRQLPGASAILAYQRVGEGLPEIGQVLALTRESGGVVTGSQFVAVQSVEAEDRNFTDERGDFALTVVTLVIGSPLLSEFVGLDTPARFSAAKGTGRVRLTRVSESSRYFGIKPLAEAVPAGAFTLRVPSVYTPVVPTTQRETGLSLVRTQGARAQLASANAQVTDSTNPGVLSAASFASITFYLRSPALPGSVTLVLPRPSSAALVLVDDGLGGFPGATGFTDVSVDYEQGLVRFTFAGSFFNTEQVATATYTPAASLDLSAHTDAIDITIATRGNVYTPNLLPLPAPGTLVVEFRALGRWYVLRDQGNGVLAGADPSYGSGVVNYATGGVVVTLGALPDIGSRVLLSWGSGIHAVVTTADAGGAARQRFTVPDMVPAVLGSAVIRFTHNGVEKVATTNAGGEITGGGITGTVDYYRGDVEIVYSAALPDPDSILRVEYTERVPPDGTPDVRLSGLFAAGLGESTGVPLLPGSVRLLVTLQSAAGQEFPQVPLADFGTGTLVLRIGQRVGDNAYSAANTVFGTVDYATGTITLDTVALGPVSVNRYSPGGQYWGTRTLEMSIQAGANAQYGAVMNVAGGTTNARVFETNVADAPLVVDLTRTTGRAVVPGSVRFGFTGLDYVDRNGLLYRGVSTATGAGTLAGSVDYASGECVLTNWAVSPAAPALSVVSCLTAYGDFTATAFQFRTAGAPLRVSSLYVQVTAEDGTLITAASDTAGVVTGTQVVGSVDYVSGVVRLSFGEIVSAAGNEGEEWFDPDDVVGGMIWRPTPVLPGTLRYSGVVLSNLPVNASILGLDPVRLPSDGRVPVFKSADVVVLHHSAAVSLGTPTPGATVSMGRADLAALWLQDAGGVKLPTTLYVANLPAGTVTIAADAVFTGYTLPIEARHRIEDMLLLTDVQINGDLTTSAPVGRDYPLGAQVSSALLFGDLYARVTGVFDQQTWTSVWSDARIGTEANAQFDDVNYPIEVLNEGATTERWRLNFTSATAYQVIGENLGVIATGTTTTDLVVNNALTGRPYLRVRWQGFGSGWAVGNQLRFNTVGATPPVWLARTVLPGATLEGDSFDAQLRGDVD